MLTSIFPSTDPKYLLKIFTLVWQMMISIMASYFIVSWALGRFVPSYQQLPEDEKLIASVHAVYALVYAVQLLPYSVVVCQMIFGADFAGTAVRNFKLVLGVFISHGVMYVVEGEFPACKGSTSSCMYDLPLSPHERFFTFIEEWALIQEAEDC